jgi:hypothetical protein
MGFKGIPMVEEPKQSRFELFQAAEAGVPEDASLEDAEPDLDLIDPGSMDRRVDEVKPGPVSSVEDLPPISVMNVEVVPNHVHGTGRIALSQGIHECQEIGLSPLSTAMAKDSPCPGLEGGQQSPRPVPPILELKASWLATPGALRRIPAFQRLDARLLVDTKHRSVLWRFQIEPTDPLDLRPELWVRAMKPHSQSVRTQLLGL